MFGNKKDFILFRYYINIMPTIIKSTHEANVATKKRRFIDIKAADKKTKRTFCRTGLIILPFDIIPRALSAAVCFHCLRPSFISHCNANNGFWCRGDSFLINYSEYHLP